MKILSNLLKKKSFVNAPVEYCFDKRDTNARYEILQMEMIFFVSSVGLLTMNLKFSSQDVDSTEITFSLLGTKFCKEVLKKCSLYL